MAEMVRYTGFKPRIIPVLGTGVADEIDRVQSIDKSGTLNKIKVEELGRDGVVEYIDQPPTVTFRMTQLEHGNLSLFKKLANVPDSDTEVTLNDFKSSTFDLCSYLEGDNGTFKGTVWLPKQRLSGFTINIGSPQGLIDRSFDLVGEDWITWQGANKYLIHKVETVESGDLESGNSVIIAVADPVAVEDPMVAGSFIKRVVRVRAGVSTELVEVTDWSYLTGNLTVEDCAVGDTIKYVYTGASYLTGIDPFVKNDSDLPGIHADSASLFLATSDYLYRLQSVSIAVSLERFDVFEIGNNEVVARGVKTKTVTITLGRILETFTQEEIFAGQVADFGKLDLREFGDKFVLKCHLYSAHDKLVYKIGFRAVDLAPTEIRGGASVGNYVEQGGTLTGQDLTISSVKATIDA